MIRLLLYFWPVILPLLICLFFIWRKRRIACKDGVCPPRFRDGPWFWAVIVSLVIGVVLVFALSLSQEQNARDYRSPLLRQLDHAP
jgi:hypothetical protein